MAVIVETGTIVAGANSYVSEQQLVDYAALRSVTITLADSTALLIEAMDSLNGRDFIGYRATRNQPLDWPRTCVCIDRYTYLSAELPPYLGEAQLALALAANSTDLMPVAAAGAAGAIIEETLGPITERFSDRGANTSSEAKVPAAQRALSKLLRFSGNSIPVFRA